jgi:hypothetical protein
VDCQAIDEGRSALPGGRQVVHAGRHHVPQERHGAGGRLRRRPRRDAAPPAWVARRSGRRGRGRRPAGELPSSLGGVVVVWPAATQSAMPAAAPSVPLARDHRPLTRPVAAPTLGPRRQCAAPTRPASGTPAWWPWSPRQASRT